VDLLPVQGRPGPADPARHRRAGRQGRQGGPGLAPVKRNRFIALDGAAKTVNRELEAKARDLAGLKGYVTNLVACPTAPPSRRPGRHPVHRALMTSWSPVNWYIRPRSTIGSAYSMASVISVSVA
jgi:hypothetical protein